jgi:hypothetical protein
MNQPTSELTPASQQAVAEAALVLQQTQGFVYMPILVPSERAGALVLERLRPALKTEPFQVPWPLPQAHTNDLAEADRRIATDLQNLVDALDNASRRLPAGALLVLDASSGSRQAVTQRLPVWLNQRREDWRRNRQGLLLLWPQSEREALLQGAPDLWSMRVAAPWVEEQMLTDTKPLLLAEPKVDGANVVPVALSPTQQRQWQALQGASRWADADLSAADVLALIQALHKANEPARALTLAERVLNAPEFGQQTDDWRASFFHSLAIVRGQQGDPAGALAPSSEAVAIYRRLARANPDVYQPVLAMNLVNQASFCSETGDRVGALALAREAVAIYRPLAQANPMAYAPDLAMSLNGLANCLNGVGDRAGALASAYEATEAYRHLAQTNPVAYDMYLATSLHNLACFLSGTGDRARALVSAQEAMTIRRRLTQANSVAYEPALAMSLNNMASFLSDNNDPARALAVAYEALEIYRRLAQSNPAVHEPDLAMSLNNLANFLSRTDDLSGAQTPARDAIAIYRRLAQANPAAYEPDLAMSLNNLANCLIKIGDNKSALAPAQEAVAIRRRLAQANPAAYEPDLAMSLWTAMRCQVAADQLEVAQEHGREVLQLFTKLAQSEPARFERLRLAVATELQQLTQS